MQEEIIHGEKERGAIDEALEAILKILDRRMRQERIPGTPSGFSKPKEEEPLKPLPDYMRSLLGESEEAPEAGRASGGVTIRIGGG